MFTFEIDPYEALITLALADSGLTSLVSTRIDVWHHYGQDSGDWGQTAQSLVLRPFDGEFHTDDQADTAWCRPLIEARCYGDSPYDCGQVWQKLMSLCSRAYRQTVTVNSQTALINYFLPQPGGGMPRLGFDEDVRPNGGMPFYSVILAAEVSAESVT